MAQATETVDGGGNGACAIFGRATVLDGATYRLPDGQAVRAFVHVPERLHMPSVVVTLHTAEEWAIGY